VSEALCVSPRQVVAREKRAGAIFSEPHASFINCDLCQPINLNSLRKHASPLKAFSKASCVTSMERVNARNNEPGLYPSNDETVASLVAKCREKTWPHLKNSTRQHYEFFMDKYLLPAWGTMKLRKMSILELQDFFNSFHPRLSAKSIRLIYACLRVHLNQGKVWGMVEKNTAIGTKLPRKKQRKPTILLPLATIGKLIELLPAHTKTVVTLIVFGSLRIGEVLALCWRHIHADRINIEERVYEGEFDDVKTDTGERSTSLGFAPYQGCRCHNGTLESRRFSQLPNHALQPHAARGCKAGGRP
jgi:hypothetical protein